MKIIAVADTHENVRKLEEVIRSEKDADLVLNLGDMRNDRDKTLPPECGYENYGVPMYFIRGNHEVNQIVDNIYDGVLRINNFIPVKPGVVIRVKKDNDLLRLGGLGGNYSEKDYWKSRTDVHRGYFVAEEVEKCKSIGVDIFISHECPVSLGLFERGQNGGIPYLDDILVSIKPKLWLSGHHHKYKEKMLDVAGSNVKLIGLDGVKDSYVVIDYTNEKVTCTKVNS